MTSAYTYTFTTSRAFGSGGQCPCTIWPDAHLRRGRFDGHELGGAGREVHARAVTALLPGSGSTRSRTTPAAIPARCGRPAAPSWPRARSRASPPQGWQELDFQTPVPVTAGTTYVASYHTTAGHYANTANGLASAVTSGPLTAVASGGVFGYGSSTTFPSSSYGGRTTGSTSSTSRRWIPPRQP